MIPNVSDTKNILEDDEFTFGEEKVQKATCCDHILLNRPLKVVLILIIVTLITPVLVYHYIFFPSLDLPPSDGFSPGSCLIPRESRLPCGKGDVTPSQCHTQCCYDFNSNVCFHRYPSRFSYIATTHWTEQLFLNPRIPTVPYSSQNSLTNIRLSIDEVSPTHLSLTFYCSENSLTGRKIEQKNYIYEVSVPELNIIVNGTQGNIFNTQRGPLIASENIWEISFKLTNETMYGLGEIPLKRDTVKIIYSHEGGMNSIPLIFAKSNESYHGLLIETMAPTEIIVKSDNQLIVRSIMNVGFKFHLFVGPKPVDIMNDVMAALGAKKALEYWMLGTHVCSEATSATPLPALQTFISTANTQKLPYDSHCGTIPVVFNTECNDTLVTLVNQGATQIRNAGKKFVPHVSPYIRYTSLPEPENEEELETTTMLQSRANERCFNDELYGHYNIRDPESNDLYKGIVDNYDVIYPNYDIVDEEFMRSLWVYNTDFEGVVLENNWPLDESKKDFEEMYKHLPYFTQKFEAVFNRTPKWNAILPDTTNDHSEFTTTESNTLNSSISGLSTIELDITESYTTESHVTLSNTTESNTTESSSTESNTPVIIGDKYLYTHNTYGNAFATAVKKIKGSIPTLTSSHWMNGNIFINRQSIPTSWSSLRKELVEASLGGISGQWYWSTPICGDTAHFNDTTHLRLCAKWYMAATYMPMIKIHSKEVLRDPLAFMGTNRAHMITALNRRMSLLPYFYSVLQEGPLLRPMFYQFPESNKLKDLTTQFAVGDNLLIIPNLEPSQTHVHAWMPPGTWYELWSGLKMDAEEGEAVTMTTTEAEFLTLICGGSIIALQKNVQLTAELTRRSSQFSLVIALDCLTSKIVNQTSTTGTTDTISTVTETVQNTNRDEGITTTEVTSPMYEEEQIDTTTEEAELTITTCEASGKLYMSENMTIIFNANGKTLTISALGEDFAVFCNQNVAKWSNFINEITIYGLADNENNYDNHRHVVKIINLCELQTNDEIVYHFVD